MPENSAGLPQIRARSSCVGAANSARRHRIRTSPARWLGPECLPHHVVLPRYTAHAWLPGTDNAQRKFGGSDGSCDASPTPHRISRSGKRSGENVPKSPQMRKHPAIPRQGEQRSKPKAAQHLCNDSSNPNLPCHGRAFKLYEVEINGSLMARMATPAHRAAPLQRESVALHFEPLPPRFPMLLFLHARKDRPRSREPFDCFAPHSTAGEVTHDGWLLPRLTAR